MSFEIDLQMAARHHQEELLAEASARRLSRSVRIQRDEPAPSGRRIQTLLRRLAGAPTFA